MRFRLANSGYGGGADGIGRGIQSLAMLPLLRAQAAEEGQTAGMRRQLLESQIAENMAQAAIKQQEQQQLAQRPDVLKLMGASRAGMSVPEFDIGLRERTQGAPAMGPQFLSEPIPGVGPSGRTAGFDDAITTLYGPAMATPADKTNWDQLSKARGNYQQQDVLDQVLRGVMDPGRAGSAVAASEGKAQFNNIGTSGAGFNVHTGEGQVLDEAMRTLFGNEGQSRIRENNAQAGASNASASLSGARRDRVVGGYDKPVTILDDDSGEANITRIPTGQAPVTVGVAPKKATGKDATNAKERNKVVSTVEKELGSTATDEEIQTEVDRRMSRRGTAPSSPVGATSSAVAKPPPPKVGAVEGGYRFKGGNPADSKNWVKAK